MEPAHDGMTLHCQDTKSSWLPQQSLGTLMAVPDGVVIVPPDDDKAKLELLKREDERQKLFDSESNEVLNIPNGYREAEVLIVRWDEKLDEFTGHTKEIENLRRIFKDKFGFGCHIENIQNSGDPQLDLNHHILSHVRSHNGEKNLLIVYYTGHGTQVTDDDGSQRLRLSAHRRRWNKSMGGFPPVAYWDDAEGPLLKNAASDVLVILDCCFASTAAVKSTDDDGRSYQMLAACHVDGKTGAPGKGSFTEALCKSLEELRNGPNRGTFSVLELVEKINTIRKDQAAISWDRLKSYKRSIQLEPLARKAKREATFQNEKLEQASLTLRLSLGVPDLDNKKITKLARSLPKTCSDAGIPIHRVKWVRMEHRDAVKTEARGVGNIVRQFADELMLRALRRRSSVGLDQESSGQEIAIPPTSQTPSLALTRKRRREDVSFSEETAEPGLCTPSGSSARSRSSASEERCIKRQTRS